MLAIISQVEGLRKSSENYTGIKYECLWSVFVDVLFFFFFFLSMSKEKEERLQLSLQVSLGKKVIPLNM